MRTAAWASRSPGTEARVVADGESSYRAPMLLPGYYRDAEATEEALPATAGCAPAISGHRRRRVPHDNRSQEGPDHHLERQEHPPVNIESALRESRYISEAVVFGDNRPYLVAMVTLDRDEAREVAARLGIAADPATIAATRAPAPRYRRRSMRVNAAFARIEQIKRFAILDHDLTQAAGELTPTLKVKRSGRVRAYAACSPGCTKRGARS